MNLNDPDPRRRMIARMKRGELLLRRGSELDEANPERRRRALEMADEARELWQDMERHFGFRK